MNYLYYMNFMPSNLSNFSKKIVDFKIHPRFIKETLCSFWKKYKKGSNSRMRNKLFKK